MINKYIEAMSNGDFEALAALFADKCRYFDYCPLSLKKNNYHLFGRSGIEMFFRNRFTFRQLSISDPVVENETTANFFANYGGNYQFVRATIDRVDEEGLIVELTVTPA